MSRLELVTAWPPAGTYVTWTRSLASPARVRSRLPFRVNRIVIVRAPALGKWRRALATTVDLRARTSIPRRPLLGAANRPRDLPAVSSREIARRLVLIVSSLRSAALTRLRLGPTGPAARDLARALPPVLLAVTTTRIDASMSRADNRYESPVRPATAAHAGRHRCHL